MKVFEWKKKENVMAFKLGYCAIRWKSPELEPSLEALKEVGWDGWECRLPLDWLGPAGRVKKICDNVDMPMAVYTAQGAPETEGYEHQERNKRRIDFAGEMGCDCFMYMSGRKPEGRDVTEDDIKKSAEAADSWAEYAAQYGLELSYHIHTNLLVDTAEDWKLYMASLEKAKLCIDVSHAQLWGYDAADSLRDFKDQLNYVHLQDWADENITRNEEGRFMPKWVSVGVGKALDFPDLANVLKETGYDRWVTSCPGAPPYEGEDSVTEAKRSQAMYDYCRGAGY